MPAGPREGVLQHRYKGYDRCYASGAGIISCSMLVSWLLVQSGNTSSGTIAPTPAASVLVVVVVAVVGPE